MSRASPATAAQVRANFAEALSDALELGLWPASDQGFSNATDLALRRLAQAYPNADDALVSAAQAAVAAQLADSSPSTPEA